MEIHILSWVKDFENTQTFKTGETIFTEGTPGTEMFVVQEGKVDIQSGGSSLDVAGVGDIIDELVEIAVGGIHNLLAALQQRREVFYAGLLLYHCRAVFVDFKTGNGRYQFSMHLGRIFRTRNPLRFL